MFIRIKGKLFNFLNMHRVGWLVGFLFYKLNIIKSSPALYKEIKILNILKKNNLTIFVETGTFKGKTAVAASPFVKKVYTLEAGINYYENLSKIFSKYKNIYLVKGKSQDHLKRVISMEKNNNKLIYLDAHWSGSDTFKQSDEIHSALNNEINILNSTRDKWKFILIDDVRHINGKNGYPTVNKIYQLFSIYCIIENKNDMILIQQKKSY
jgi:hypothetical protein